MAHGLICCLPHGHPIWGAGSLLAILLLTQFPTNAFWQAADDGSRAWSPAICMGAPSGHPDSWLQTGAVSVIVGIQRVNQQMDNQDVSISFQ